MMDYLIPEDSTRDDTKQQENTRRLANQPIDTPKDREFTQNEVRQAIESFKPRKAPEPDGVTGGNTKTCFLKHSPNSNRDV
jgi:hypothetical protein